MTHSYVGLHTCKGGPHLEQTIRETDESGNLYKYMYPRRGTPFPIRPQTNPNSKNTPLVPARITIFPHSPIQPISTFTLQRLLHLLPALWRGGRRVIRRIAARPCARQCSSLGSTNGFLPPLHTQVTQAWWAWWMKTQGEGGSRHRGR